MSPLSCVCDCASCKTGNHVRCYYEQPCRGPQLSDKLIPDSKTLLRLADWIRHAGPNHKGEFPPIDSDTLRRIAIELDTADTKLASAKSEIERFADENHELGTKLDETRQLLAACRALRSIEHRIQNHNNEDEELQS